MNCLVVCQSRLWIVTIVFYTCIFIPFTQLKGVLASMLISFIMIFFSYDTKDMAKEIHFSEIPSLPVTRYQDLRSHSCVGGGDDEHTEEICSICLVEYQSEDSVTKLGRCGHVFHLNCIEQWIDRSQFSCPLCRSFLFSQRHICFKN